MQRNNRSGILFFLFVRVNWALLRCLWAFCLPNDEVFGFPECKASNMPDPPGSWAANEKNSALPIPIALESIRPTSGDYVGKE